MLDNNFDIRRQLEHFEYDMNSTLALMVVHQLGILLKKLQKNLCQVNLYLLYLLEYDNHIFIHTKNKFYKYVQS